MGTYAFLSSVSVNTNIQIQYLKIYFKIYTWLVKPDYKTIKYGALKIGCNVNWSSFVLVTLTVMISKSTCLNDIAQKETLWIVFKLGPVPFILQAAKLSLCLIIGSVMKYCHNRFQRIKLSYSAPRATEMKQTNTSLADNSKSNYGTPMEM